MEAFRSASADVRPLALERDGLPRVSDVLPSPSVVTSRGDPNSAFRNPLLDLSLSGSSDGSAIGSKRSPRRIAGAAERADTAPGQRGTQLFRGGRGDRDAPPQGGRKDGAAAHSAPRTPRQAISRVASPLRRQRAGASPGARAPRTPRRGEGSREAPGVANAFGMPPAAAAAPPAPAPAGGLFAAAAPQVGLRLEADGLPNVREAMDSPPSCGSADESADSAGSALLRCLYDKAAAAVSRRATTPDGGTGAAGAREARGRQPPPPEARPRAGRSQSRGTSGGSPRPVLHDGYWRLPMDIGADTTPLQERDPRPNSREGLRSQEAHERLGLLPRDAAASRRPRAPRDGRGGVWQQAQALLPGAHRAPWPPAPLPPAPGGVPQLPGAWAAGACLPPVSQQWPARSGVARAHEETMPQTAFPELPAARPPPPAAGAAGPCSAGAGPPGARAPAHCSGPLPPAAAAPTAAAGASAPATQGRMGPPAAGAAAGAAAAASGPAAAAGAAGPATEGRMAAPAQAGPPPPVAGVGANAPAAAAQAPLQTEGRMAPPARAPSAGGADAAAAAVHEARAPEGAPPQALGAGPAPRQEIGAAVHAARAPGSLVQDPDAGGCAGGPAPPAAVGQQVGQAHTAGAAAPPLPPPAAPPQTHQGPLPPQVPGPLQAALPQQPLAPLQAPPAWGAGGGAPARAPAPAPAPAAAAGVPPAATQGPMGQPMGAFGGYPQPLGHAAGAANPHHVPNAYAGMGVPPATPGFVGPCIHPMAFDPSAPVGYHPGMFAGFPPQTPPPAHHHHAPFAHAPAPPPSQPAPPAQAVEPRSFLRSEGSMPPPVGGGPAAAWSALPARAHGGVIPGEVGLGVPTPPAAPPAPPPPRAGAAPPPHAASAAAPPVAEPGAAGGVAQQWPARASGGCSGPPPPSSQPHASGEVDELRRRLEASEAAIRALSRERLAGAAADGAGAGDAGEGLAAPAAPAAAPSEGRPAAPAPPPPPPPTAGPGTPSARGPPGAAAAPAEPAAGPVAGPCAPSTPPDAPVAAAEPGAAAAAGAADAAPGDGLELGGGVAAGEEPPLDLDGAAPPAHAAPETMDSGIQTTPPKQLALVARDQQVRRRGQGPLRKPRAASGRLSLVQVGLERFDIDEEGTRPARHRIGVLCAWKNESVVYERVPGSELPTPVAVQYTKPSMRTERQALEDMPVPSSQPAPLAPPPSPAGGGGPPNVEEGEALAPSPGPAPVTPPPSKRRRRSSAARPAAPRPVAQPRAAAARPPPLAARRAAPSAQLAAAPAAGGQRAAARRAEAAEGGARRRMKRPAAAAPAPEPPRKSPRVKPMRRPAGRRARGEEEPEEADEAAGLSADEEGFCRAPSAAGQDTPATARGSPQAAVEPQEDGEAEDASDEGAELETPERLRNPAALQSLEDGFVRLPEEPGSKHGCELKVNHSTGCLMSCDIRIPPESGNAPEIMWAGKTLLLHVHTAPPKQLIILLDGNRTALEQGDICMVRAGQEWSVSNGSKRVCASIKMVLRSRADDAATVA